MGAVVQSHREEGLAPPSGVRWHLDCQWGQRALRSPTFTLTPKSECRQSSVAGEAEGDRRGASEMRTGAKPWDLATRKVLAAWARAVWGVGEVRLRRGGTELAGVEGSGGVAGREQR